MKTFGSAKYDHVLTRHKLVQKTFTVKNFLLKNSCISSFHTAKLVNKTGEVHIT